MDHQHTNIITCHSKIKSLYQNTLTKLFCSDNKIKRVYCNLNVKLQFQMLIKLRYENNNLFPTIVLEYLYFVV